MILRYAFLVCLCGRSVKEEGKGQRIKRMTNWRNIDRTDESTRGRSGP